VCFDVIEQEHETERDGSGVDLKERPRSHDSSFLLCCCDIVETEKKRRDRDSFQLSGRG
jgi:hypothetical protein